jgi:DNA-binding MarR family transcriptional regulator
VVSDLPGGPRGYQVLAAAAQPAGNQGNLAQQLGIDRTVLTYLVDDLEQAGLVERHTNPADRRSKLVVATEHGRSVLSERLLALGHVEQQLLEPLGEDAPTFRTLLQRLAPATNTADPIASTCEIVEQLTRLDGDGDGAGNTRPRRRG